MLGGGGRAGRLEVTTPKKLRLENIRLNFFFLIFGTWLRTTVPKRCQNMGHSRTCSILIQSSGTSVMNTREQLPITPNRPRVARNKKHDTDVGTSQWRPSTSCSTQYSTDPVKIKTRKTIQYCGSINQRLKMLSLTT